MKRIFISILILAPLLAFAQFSDAGAGATIRISPSLPNPLSQTKASLIYDGFDLTKASIRWTLNNKTIKSGTGAKDVTFQVGPAGSDNRLSVFAASLDGEEIEAAINIVPSVIDILMESCSYVPKWYKGGSLTTQGSKVIRLCTISAHNSMIPLKYQSRLEQYLSRPRFLLRPKTPQIQKAGCLNQPAPPET